MKRGLVSQSICVQIAVMSFIALSAGAAHAGAVQVRLNERHLAAGTRTVVVNVYTAAEGGAPVASETQSVRVDERGSFTLGVPASAESWVSVRVPPGNESRRVRLEAAPGRRVTVNVITDAAITANGLIESIAQGFRFPDGTIQTSAATVSGGVPSVNGIAGAVTIAGAGTTSVQTAGSTITVTGPAFGAPVGVGASSSAGVATTIARADHVHAHGDQAGGSLHATATVGSAGFLSATDKEKLDDTVVYVRTVVVSPIPGDPAGSGTLLLNALNGISGNSATNPYLLKIEPGIYDIGATALAMKTYVDIEGSGENATFIVASRGNSSLTSVAAAVISAANAELRQLTVTNTAPGSLNGVGVFVSTLGMRITHVTINSTGASQSSVGLFATSSATLTVSRATILATGTGGTSAASGIQLSTGAKLTLRDSNITGKGVGGTGTNNGVNVSSQTAAATIDSCTVIATGTGGQNNGVNVAPGTATITNSTIQADTNGSRSAVSTSAQATAVANVFHSRLLALSTGSTSAEVSLSKGANSTLRVATSQIDSASTGTPKCVHVYNANMDNLNNVCPAPAL